MNVIDDEGNLFGLVNVVDALAVLLVLAVVAAGAAFVLQPEPEPEPPELTTTNATLDLGTQPDYIVDRLNEGDTYSPGGDNEITVTDVHLTPRDGRTAVLLRVRLRGPVSGDGLRYDGAPPRLGRTLGIQTDAYQVQGTVVDVGGGDALATAEESVLVEATVDAATAADIDEGDAFSLRQRTLATVESVTVYGTGNPDRKRVLVGLSLSARDAGDELRFAGTSLREGNAVPFRVDEYGFRGEIRRVGATEPRGTATTETVTLQLRDVPPELASSIRAGMRETSGGDTLARIASVDRTNATVVLTSDDGNIYEREHPVNQDLTMEVELRVRETATGTTFKSRTIQQGSTVVLDLGSVTVRATVVDL
ncbi:DUF4330 family protein [Halobaculum sp. EA56]|uniref:DUF4330 family protein n=1 Tax=Halobaculum sp. EA56 TaxID=3421648 RepID=UPI003EB9A40B